MFIVNVGNNSITRVITKEYDFENRVITVYYFINGKNVHIVTA